MMDDIKLRKFKEDGYVTIENFLSAEDIKLLKREIESLINKMPEQNNRSIFNTTNTQQSKDLYFMQSADKISYFFEAGALSPSGELIVSKEISLNKMGHALHKYNDIFKKITTSSKVKQLCQQLGFEDPAIAQSMYIFKNPGIGSEVTPHQDASYLYTEPQNIVGFWIALDDATVENGCLWFEKKSHKNDIHRRYIRNPNKNSSELFIYDKPNPSYKINEFVSVPVSKGTCILIDGQVVHYSPVNSSTTSRHAYTFHIIEQKDTKYSEENWLQLPNGEKFLSLSL